MPRYGLCDNEHIDGGEARRLCTLASRQRVAAALGSLLSGPLCTGYWRVKVMLETIAVVLLVLWAVGLVSSYTMGGFIHILLVVAVVLIAVRLIQGRRI